MVKRISNKHRNIQEESNTLQTQKLQLLFIIISPVKNKKHTKSYMLNDNRFTVYFISSTVSKKTSGCRQMKEKNSCLKGYWDLEKTQLNVSRKN